MNILQILPELNVGGVETGTVELAREMLNLGHKSVVVSNGGELVGDLKETGVIHYSLPVHKKSLFSIIRMIPELVKIIIKEEIDIVHARSRVPAWIAYFACRRTGCIFITTCHGHYKKHPFSYVMGWGKRVIALSNVIAQHMIEDFDTPYERIRLIPRSVDLKKFRYQAGASKISADFNVGIIGRITPLKGHMYFIKAMAKVAKVVPNLKIWIVGDAPESKGAYKEQLQLLTKRLGLWNMTQFLGVQKDVPSVMSQLDVMVLATTSHEAFGRVIVEAQASGVPVVATRVGGVVDIIQDQETGLLVTPADALSIAQAVTRLFSDPALRQKLTERAYLKVKEKYSLDLMVKNTLNVYREALENFNILVIKMSSLGDIILSTAALRALRKSLGTKFKIICLSAEDSKEALLTCPYIDDLLVCDLKNRDRGFFGLWRLGRQLRMRNIDIALDLQNNRKSHILSFLSWAPRRIGYRNNKFGFLLTQGIPDDKAALDPVSHQFRLLKMLGIESEDKSLEIWPTAKDEAYVNEFLNSQWINVNQKICGINISASKRWSSKNWPLAYLVKLCDELGLRDIRVIVTGTQQDMEEANKLSGLVKNTKIINACGRTSVNQLACLIKRCNVFISCDSAPLHIAAAVGVPFVALFGPTDYRRHMPYAKNAIVINKALPCGPCYRPNCKTNKCMKLITPEELLETVTKII